jgi:hypothetical protein
MTLDIRNPQPYLDENLPSIGRAAWEFYQETGQRIILGLRDGAGPVDDETSLHWLSEEDVAALAGEDWKQVLKTLRNSDPAREVLLAFADGQGLLKETRLLRCQTDIKDAYEWHKASKQLEEMSFMHLLSGADDEMRNQDTADLCERRAALIEREAERSEDALLRAEQEADAGVLRSLARMLRSEEVDPEEWASVSLQQWHSERDPVTGLPHCLLIGLGVDGTEHTWKLAERCTPLEIAAWRTRHGEWL